jgi:hypothetical protein
MIKNRQSFISHVEQLHIDLLENPDSWENPTLPRFLEALAAVAKDIQNSYSNNQKKLNADEPSWQVFADMLTAASVYE